LRRTQRTEPRVPCSGKGGWLAGASIEGVKLLDNMAHDGNWYLQPNGHDFFAFTAKPDAVISDATPHTQGR
jgi:hypothetical protein